jgi:hypothetical protein
MAEVTIAQPQTIKPVSSIVRTETRPGPAIKTMIQSRAAHAEQKRLLKLLRPQGRMR